MEILQTVPSPPPVPPGEEVEAETRARERTVPGDFRGCYPS